MLYCNLKTTLQNKLFCLHLHIPPRLCVFICNRDRSCLITCSSFNEVNRLIKKLAEENAIRQTQAVVNGKQSRDASGLPCKPSKSPRHPGLQARDVIKRFWTASPTYEFVRSSELAFWSTSWLRRISCLWRVLLQLHVKTCRGVGEDAGKKANFAVLALKRNIWQTKRRSCIQFHTLVKICYYIKPPKHELSP